ncbi:MAG: hypothetical protein OEZ36_01235, partial [Spirochaetota bacterium]|nr:hypothetical protein [Spirochaetota bacterium]
MKRIHWSVALFLLGIGALASYVLLRNGPKKLSGDLEEYKLSGIPFCPKKADEEMPNYFRQKHILLVKSATSYNRSPLSGNVATDSPSRKLIDS